MKENKTSGVVIKCLQKKEKNRLFLNNKRSPKQNCKTVIGITAINPIKHANNSLTIEIPSTRILRSKKTVTKGTKQRIIAEYMFIK